MESSYELCSRIESVLESFKMVFIKLEISVFITVGFRNYYYYHYHTLVTIVIVVIIVITVIVLLSWNFFYEYVCPVGSVVKVAEQIFF